MKKVLLTIIAVLLTLTLVAALAGCGSDKSKDDKKDGKGTDVSTEAQNAGGAMDAKDLVFSYNGVSVELDGDADAAVAALGEPKDKSSQLSCHGEGDDKTYTYDGFVLNTYPLEGKDRVLEIGVTSADIPTSKGIKVGDTAEAVTEAYGADFKEVGMYHAYSSGEGKSLQFFIQDGKVQEISYYYDV